MGFELTVMLIMIGVNSFFAGYEIALASVTMMRLQRLADEGKHGAKVALYMKQNMEASLAVVQLGITLVGAIAAAVGGAGAGEKLAPMLMVNLNVSEKTAELLAIGIIVLPLTVVTIVVGELIPKVFALRNAEWVCLKLSPFMRWFSFSVWPAVWLFEAIVIGVMSWGERRLGKKPSGRPETAELQDLRATVALARSSRLIGPREEEIMLGAAELGSRPVREIMLSAEHINTLGKNDTLSESLIVAHLHMHTRFPVVEKKGDPQTIVGYVNVKDVIAALHLQPNRPTIEMILRPIPSLRDNQTIAECLERLMRDHTHIALIRNADARVVGMITLEDILEEMVGDIQDEYDGLPSHIVASGSDWVVGGGVTLDRLKGTTGIDLTSDSPSSPPRTLSDWVASHLEREVRGGDVLERASVRVVVRKVRRAKVQEAQIGHTKRG